ARDREGAPQQIHDDPAPGRQAPRVRGDRDPRRRRDRCAHVPGRESPVRQHRDRDHPDRRRHRRFSRGGRRGGRHRDRHDRRACDLRPREAEAARVGRPDPKGTDMESEGIRSPLHDTQIAMGAEMIWEDGWPWTNKITDPEKEYEAIRSATGLWDLFSTCKYEVTGPDAGRVIQRRFTNDVSTM